MAARIHSSWINKEWPFLRKVVLVGSSTLGRVPQRKTIGLVAIAGATGKEQVRPCVGKPIISGVIMCWLVGKLTYASPGSKVLDLQFWFRKSPFTITTL